jgi:polyribonucleotide nucleotidyltransferase
MVKKYTLPELGYEVEIGKVARQADGAVWFKHGGTVVLSTVVSAASSEFPGFLPLTVDYREYSSAAGKIPGGFYKREGKPSDREVLTGRLIDRAIRPIFPHRFFDQVQALSTVYSVDKEHTPYTLALLATSLALSVSDIPFLAPVAAVEVGRIDGKWVINPTYIEGKNSDVRLIVAGTAEGLCMVEGTADQISETEMVDALFLAHDMIKKIVAWQLEIQREIGKEKKPINTALDWDVWEKRALDFLTEERAMRLFVEDKALRSQALDELNQLFIAHAHEVEPELEISDKYLMYILDHAIKIRITDLVFKLKHRVDNRANTEVRPISIEVGLLPFTHGSSLFTRGQTQALTSVTFGSGQDEQRLESIMDTEAEDGSFMLHYNFPPFSVGEVRPMRGTGRREVGHGHLAASSFKYMLPNKEQFPYTIRIVTDILESNGSSSMATVCGSTMAMMQGGVPIKKMVGGVAMGLLKSSHDEFIVLTDISGFEDNFGLMDFKVTGTTDGITAIQLDIKDKTGLSRQVFVSALNQAKEGRLHILSCMRECMSEPSKTMSELVPRVVSMKIDKEKIGAVIGTGGKTIREIIEKTKVQSIDIEDDGIVKIFGASSQAIDAAIAWIKVLVGQIDVGAEFKGPIKRIAEFGLFVELVPGQDGLVHVSNIPREKQRTFQNDYKVGDIVAVKVVDYDDATGRIRLRLLEQ